MRKFTALEIYNQFKKKGYQLHEEVMDMNIFGVRNSDPNSNAFDDCVGILYRDINKELQVVQFDATTDPGMYYRLKPINNDGTAIIVPGQHLNCYKVGLHTGYEAMEQIAPMSYVRDNNKNSTLDFLYKVTGFKAFKQVGKTNIHHAGEKSKLVDKWSAGCQVIATLSDWFSFITLIKKSIAYGKPNKFNYTLFEIENFNQ